MFPAYHDTGVNSRSPQTNENQYNYNSFPHSRLQSQRDYAEESRIKESRQRKAARDAAEEKIKRMKEDLTHYELYTRDSDEVDDDDYPSIPLSTPSVTIATPNIGQISRKHRQFVQPSLSEKVRYRRSSTSSSSSFEIKRELTSTSSRSSHRRHKKSRKSKKSRRHRSRSRTPSPSPRSSSHIDDTLVYEGSERGSRRRFKHLTKTNKYDYERFKYWIDATKADPRQSYILAKHPAHDNYSYDRLDKLEVMTCPSNVVMCVKNDRVFRDSKIEVVALKKKKATRFHLIKFERDKYENSFRNYGYGFNNEFVPLSKDEEKFEESWEIAERRKLRDQEEDEMLSIRRDAVATGSTLDDEVLQIKTRINRNPKIASNYLDFVRAEDRVFEKDRMMELHSNDRTALNERKLAILDEGIKRCSKNPSLLLEKIEILKTTKPDEVESLWRKILHIAPNDLNIHRAYLDYIQYDAQVYTQKKLSAAFARTRSTLESLLNGSFVSHEPQEGTREMLLEIWIREIKWLFAQGLYAEALASVQASVEISHFFPPSEDKRALFKKFWESGAPRIGDVNHMGGFLNFEAVPPREELMNIERKELLDELNKCQSVYKMLKSDMSNAEAFVSLEQAMEEASYRPLRFHPNGWDPSTDELIAEHVKDRHYVPFKDLVLFDFVGNDCLMAFSAFGLYIYSVPQFINWYAAAHDFGIKLGSPDIPPEVFLYLFRIQFQLVQMSGMEFLYYTLAKNIVSYAVQKKVKKPEEAALHVLNELKPRFPEDEAIFQVTKFQLYQTLVEWKLIPMKRLAEVVSVVLGEVKKKNNRILTRIASAYVLLATEHLNVDNAKMRSFMTKCMTAVLGEPEGSLSNALLFKKKLDDICRIPDYIDDGASEAMNNVLPSLKSLIFCIQLHFIACFPSHGSHNYIKQAESQLQWFSSSVDFDPRGNREAIYTFLRIRRRHWQENHSGREELVSLLQNYLTINKSFYDDRAIRIAIELLQSRSGTVLPPKRSGKTNPFAGSWSSDPLKPIYETLEKMAICGKKIEGHPDSVRILHDIVVNIIDKVAEQHREPFLWRILVGEKDETFYTKAIAQCRWSKSIHLERVKKNNTSVVLKEVCELMNQTRIRLHVNIEDLPTYRELLQDRSNS